MNNQHDRDDRTEKDASETLRPKQIVETDFIRRLKTLINGDSVASFGRKCGIHESTIRSYLARGKQPRMEHLAAIANANGVTVDWLSTGKGIKYIRDLKQEKSELNGAPPRAYGELPDALKPYEKRLDKLLHYLAMIEDEAEVEQILTEVTLRAADKVIELTELKKTVNEMRAQYLKKNTSTK